MALCPVCQANIEDDFGLVTCKACGSSVLIDFDGQANAKGEVAAPANENLVEGSPNGQEYQELSFDNAAAPELVTATVMASSIEVTTVLSSSDMSDLESFGNSDAIAASAAQGSLKFNLYISGLDTLDVRQAVVDSLNDSKLGWSMDQLVAKIKNGELMFEGLTPIRCAIVVQRLRSVSVEIRWEQYAIQQV